MIESRPVQASAVVDPSKINKNSSLADILVHFVNETLLRAIWDENVDSMTYGDGSMIFGGRFKLNMIGAQNRPVEGQERDTCPIRQELQEHSEYFRHHHLNDLPPGETALETLTAPFLVTSEHFEDLSLSFQDVMADLGQILVALYWT